MTRPRWPPELVAQLIRRNKEDGVSLEALGKEYGVSRQAIWCALHRDKFNAARNERRSIKRRKRKLGLDTAKQL